MIMPTLLLRIDGLSRGDEERIEQVLRVMPGVFGVVVSPSEGRAEVDFEDDEADLDAILTRLQRAGFSASVAG
jgi:copper chaperone CopZ